MSRLKAKELDNNKEKIDANNKIKDSQLFFVLNKFIQIQIFYYLILQIK